MTAEQDGLDLAGVLVDHRGNEIEGCGPDLFCIECDDVDWPCLPYRLAALALDLRGKVARVEAALVADDRIYNVDRAAVLAALADPTPAARCPQQTPFVALSEPTCTRPEGHEGAHLFTSYAGKTPLEMMPK